VVDAAGGDHGVDLGEEARGVQRRRRRPGHAVAVVAARAAVGGEDAHGEAGGRERARQVPGLAPALLDEQHLPHAGRA